MKALAAGEGTGRTRLRVSGLRAAAHSSASQTGWGRTAESAAGLAMRTVSCVLGTGLSWLDALCSKAGCVSC